MARSVTLGNGALLVGLDMRGQVRDLYFPHVGHSNHVSGASGSYVHRIGVFADDRVSWLDDPAWDISVGCDAETVVGSMRAVNDSLGVTLTSSDVVHNERNVFIRSFTLQNDRKKTREVKLFLCQQFRISESRRGDTGFYDPRVNAIIHYKGHQKFLINAVCDGVPFTDYSIGLFDIEGRAGTYRDAEDGVLEQNPIEHGSVDSVLGLTAKLKGGARTEIHYWVACASTIDAVHQLNAEVLEETPRTLIASTKNYWHAWITKDTRDLSALSPDLQRLYKHSLVTMRLHADNGGGIIASSDTDMLHHGRDTYSYVWPRDASIIAHALDRAGYSDVSRAYFTFMAGRLEQGGYLYHKYRVDGVLGSSWHPWVHNGIPQLPIQEDETATLMCMIYEHYEMAHDLEFIESLYNPFIEPAAEFMCEYMESSLGLPGSSYDLWEEKYGIATYTASSVCAALNCAARFANLLGKQDAARRYKSASQGMQRAIIDRLYDDDLGMFVKLVRLDDARGEIETDATLDISSFFGPIFFGVIAPDDPRVSRAFKTVEETLRVRGDMDGYIRYVGDNYYTLQDTGSPNPWVVATLWVAQYHLMVAKKKSDLARAYALLEWTAAHAEGNGMLAEQMHPVTGAHLSTAPLVWSHAEFVITVEEYLKALARFQKG